MSYHLQLSAERSVTKHSLKSYKLWHFRFNTAWCAIYDIFKSCVEGGNSPRSTMICRLPRSSCTWELIRMSFQPICWFGFNGGHNFLKKLQPWGNTALFGGVTPQYGVLWVMWRPVTSAKTWCQMFKSRVFGYHWYILVIGWRNNFILSTYRWIFMKFWGGRYYPTVGVTPKNAMSF